MIIKILSHMIKIIMGKINNKIFFGGLINKSSSSSSYIIGINK